MPVHIAAVFDHDAHTVPSGFVADRGDALDTLVLDAVCHRLDERRLVDLIGNFGHNNAVFFFFDLGARTDCYTPPPGCIRLKNAPDAADRRRRGEVGSFYKLHQVADCRVGMIHEVDSAVDNLTEVVRRNVCRHTDRDAYRAVDKQVGETRGQHCRLHQLIVEVGFEIDDILADIAHHFSRQPRHLRFCITVCSRAVAVDITEVALSVDKRVAHGERLRKPYHGIIDRRIAVRVITPQHVTDCFRRFFAPAAVCQAVLIHGVKDAAMHGFKPVAYIGQRAAGDNRHSILNKRSFNFFIHVYIVYFLVFKFNIFVFFVFALVLFCHFFILYGITISFILLYIL